MSDRFIEGSSKTYRKATRLLAEKLGVEPEATEFPSADFAKMISYIRDHPESHVETLVEVARQYFRLGVRKGLRVAVSKMAEGHFTVGRKWITVYDDTSFAARVKMPDGKQHRITFTYSASNIGLRE